MGCAALQDPEEEEGDTAGNPGSPVLSPGLQLAELCSREDFANLPTRSRGLFLICADTLCAGGSLGQTTFLF